MSPPPRPPIICYDLTSDGSRTWRRVVKSIPNVKPTYTSAAPAIATTTTTRPKRNLSQAVTYKSYVAPVVTFYHMPKLDRTPTAKAPTTSAPRSTRTHAPPRASPRVIRTPKNSRTPASRVRHTPTTTKATRAFTPEITSTPRSIRIIEPTPIRKPNSVPSPEMTNTPITRSRATPAIRASRTLTPRNLTTPLRSDREVTPPSNRMPLMQIDLQDQDTLEVTDMNFFEKIEDQTMMEVNKMMNNLRSTLEGLKNL